MTAWSAYWSAYSTARYSMGGFGAFQLGCFAPEIFDAVVSVAGYGLGTSEPNSGYGAPQPASGAWDFHIGM